MPLPVQNAATRRSTMPILAMGALALAGVVWLIPLPRPEPIALDPTFPPPPPPAKERAIPPEAVIPLEEWGALASAFDAIVETIQMPVFAEGEAEPEQQPAAQPAQPARPTLPPLSWRYRGMISGPGGIAALVSGPGWQRFLFEGQVVPDDADPGGAVSIVSITEDHITVERRGNEERIGYEKHPIPTPFGVRPGFPTSMR